MPEFTPPKPFLYWLARPLEKALHIISRIRRSRYEKGKLIHQSLPGIVVSVGNLAFGGTGKSPVIISLATQLKNRHKKVAIITRGYKSGLGKNEAILIYNQKTSALLGTPELTFIHPDEAKMQSEKLKGVPVICGRNRLKAARMYLAKNTPPDIWLIDDGMQHLRIRRDVDLVLMDAKYPFGNRRLTSLFQREPLASLSAKHTVVFTRANGQTNNSFKNYLSDKNISHTDCPFNYLPPKAISEVNKAISRPLLVAAIARPEGILETWPKNTPRPVATLFLKDHERIKPELLQKQLAKQGCDCIITTEKDFCRDKSVFSELKNPTYLLPIEAEVAHILTALKAKEINL